MSYTHILAPTDFSPLANHALAHAFAEAAAHHAKLTLLHALHHHPDTEVYYLKGHTDPRGVAGEFGDVSVSSGSIQTTISSRRIDTSDYARAVSARTDI